MITAKNANPNPDSVTASVLPKCVVGVTSPYPSVKKVVPLMYRYVPKSIRRSSVCSAFESDQFKIANPRINPHVHEKKSPSSDNGPKNERNASRRFPPEIRRATNLQTIQLNR